MKNKRIITTVFCLISCCMLLLASCKKYVSSTYLSLENNSWYIDDTLHYAFDIDDLNNTYTLKYNVRINEDYRYRNLFLFTTTTLPDNTLQNDTLQFILSDEHGNSYGRGLSGQKEIVFTIDNTCTFSQKGAYNIDIQHGMRDNPLEGIKKLGLVIEKN